MEEFYNALNIETAIRLLSEEPASEPQPKPKRRRFLFWFWLG